MRANSTLAKAVRFALISGATTAVLSTSVAIAAEDGAKVERIEVTGSRIKRTDMETATPVTVLSADDMAKQGFTNVQDALQMPNFNHWSNDDSVSTWFYSSGIINQST